MPWAKNVVESRRYAMQLLSEGMSASQVASAVGVSRQTIQKWKKRKQLEGESGLVDRSHAPLTHPFAVSDEMERLVLRFRRRYREGPRKLRVYLLEQHPGKRIPAASTIGRILKRHELTEKRPKRSQRLRAPTTSLTEPTQPNDVWCIDFKGEFEVGGRLCYPLTVTDGFSRFAIATKAESGQRRELVHTCLWRAFGRYGLPKVIRSDNGRPFAALKAPLGLSRLAVLWLRLGIQVERIDPGRPYQNGAHERYHKTLKHSTAKPPADTFAAQQKRFDRFRVHYNRHRPHESLEMRRPAELYTPSERIRPRKIPPIQHPGAQLHRKVTCDGRINLRGHEIPLSKAFIGETVGLTEIQSGIYQVGYGALPIAHISFRRSKPTVAVFR